MRFNLFLKPEQQLTDATLKEETWGCVQILRLPGFRKGNT